ncbi:MAG: hypothetical protein QOH74_511, partial [Gaiellales bacterium]|nr:hypothetical protein [Gaiellales bacterium]
GDQDAIRVELEAPEHEPVTILVPYDEGPVLGEPFGVDSEARIFTP